MSPARTVGVWGDDAAFRDRQQAVWGSLPATLVPAGDRPELLAVDGRGDWLPRLRAAAEQQGVRGIVLVAPSADVDPGAVRQIDDAFAQGRLAVVTARAWPGHPALEQLAARARPSDPVTLIDSVAVAGQANSRTGADLLLEQVALVRVVHGPVDRITWASVEPGRHRCAARAGDAVVALAGVSTGAGPSGVRLAAYRASGETHVRVPDGDTAEPPEIAIIGQAGELRLPTWYEAPARSAWRRLAETVAAHQLSRDLVDLANDVDVVAAARSIS